MFHQLSNNSGLKSALKMLNFGVVAVISLVFIKPRRFGVRPFIAAAYHPTPTIILYTPLDQAEQAD
jgi:hypothetical protein